jgi:hypothetical protein
MTMCPKCGGPLTAAGNCANLCGGAVAPAPVLLLDETARAEARLILAARL